jgi:DNA-binding protein YbaB
MNWNIGVNQYLDNRRYVLEKVYFIFLNLKDMLGNMKDLKRMFDAYRKLQEALQNTIIRAKEEGVIVEISADMKLKWVKIEDENLLNPASKSVLEERIKRAFEKGQQKAQEVAMQKTKEILGVDPNDIANMLWGGLGGGNFKLPWF